MAGAFISAEMHGDEEFEKLLGKIVKKSGNAKPAWEIAGQVVLNSVQKNFEDQGRPEKWKRLSRATLLSSAGKNAKTKKGRFRKSAQRKIKAKEILINRGFNGGLLGSINSKATQHSAVVGSPKIYAAIHNNGGKAGRNKNVVIPKREYLLIQDEDWGTIGSGFLRFLVSN